MAGRRRVDPSVRTDELDALYALPLDEFTAARNELAKRLRTEGERERADDVRALAKPSVPAWTANQLARRRAARVRDLLAAGEAVRKAQERALRGEGGDALRKATQDERRLVNDLRREARALLEESGRPTSDALLERVASTLSNAAVDPEARPLLEAGRLTEEVASSGFDAFAGMAVPAAPARRPAAKAKPKPAARPAKGDAAAKRRHAAELRSRARDLEREARAAEREAERTAVAAERATRTAERAAAEAAEAAEAARSARAAADEARAEADAAA